MCPVFELVVGVCSMGAFLLAGPDAKLLENPPSPHALGREAIGRGVPRSTRGEPERAALHWVGTAQEHHRRVGVVRRSKYTSRRVGAATDESRRVHQVNVVSRVRLAEYVAQLDVVGVDAQRLHRVVPRELVGILPEQAAARVRARIKSLAARRTGSRHLLVGPARRIRMLRLDQGTARRK